MQCTDLLLERSVSIVMTAVMGMSSSQRCFSGADAGNAGGHSVDGTSREVTSRPVPRRYYSHDQTRCCRATVRPRHYCLVRVVFADAGLLRRLELRRAAVLRTGVSRQRPVEPSPGRPPVVIPTGALPTVGLFRHAGRCSAALSRISESGELIQPLRTTMGRKTFIVPIRRQSPAVRGRGE